MPCPDSGACLLDHDPAPDDNGLWTCSSTGRAFYQCVLCAGSRAVRHWWRAGDGPYARGVTGDTRRYVHQLGWLCISQEPSWGNHPSTCECGQPAHTATSQCPLNSPPVLAHCDGCGDDDVVLCPDNLCEGCTDWHNEDCPALCMTQHAGPGTTNSRRTSAEFRCPDTREMFGWCDACFEWRDTGMPTRINGTWYCDPYEHGYIPCEACEEWYDEDDYCPCSEDDDDYEGGESRRGEPIVTCSQCHTPNTIFNEITETFVCGCAAEVLRSRKVPLKMVSA